MTLRQIPLAFTLAEAHAASEAWGANCGPGALAAVLGLALDAVHPHLEKFDQKRYTNPSMMRVALRSLGVDHEWRVGRFGLFPSYGLARVQWDGPWTKPGVPPAAAYRHTHWVGSAMPDRAVSDPHDVEIFDINAMCVGGWIDLPQWSTQLVPWLLKQCEPKATGAWWLTHIVEITPCLELRGPVRAERP
jgi:hypothetical protein